MENHLEFHMLWKYGLLDIIHLFIIISSANAIIRVFHGSINVSLYPFLCDSMDGIEPFGNADFDEGDITWISANYNQVHQLKNLETNSKHVLLFSVILMMKMIGYIMIILII